MSHRRFQGCTNRALSAQRYFFPATNFLVELRDGSYRQTNFLFGNYGLRRAEKGEDMPSETSEGVKN